MSALPKDFLLPARLYPLRSHPIQLAYANSTHRFNVVPAGRRSGKTERAKRKLVKKALQAPALSKFQDPRFFAGAPTRDQAKSIFWKDLKLMFSPLVVANISESELKILLVTGVEVCVIGMDKPQRIEGSPWDGGLLDEYANMKPRAFDENVRPALADRHGWCDLIGVPEGRNHYYEKAQYAQFGDAKGRDPDWAFYTWFSADILPTEEVEAARRSMDELTFQQEFEGSFVNFEGRAYYPFSTTTHVGQLAYDKRQPLIFTFDFNVAPGTAAVIQEQKLPNGLDGTGVIGEVHIPKNSNTPAVCRRLAADWKTHEGTIHCFGDATGGATGSAKVAGSDWEIIRGELLPVFGDRLHFHVKSSNPPERSRVNSVNSRLRSACGEIRMMVDGGHAPNVAKDFDGVTLLKGGSGEIDKKATPMLTHLTDGIGYYIYSEYPTSGPAAGMMEMTGI